MALLLSSTMELPDQLSLLTCAREIFQRCSNELPSFLFKLKSFVYSRNFSATLCRRQGCHRNSSSDVFSTSNAYEQSVYVVRIRMSVFASATFMDLDNVKISEMPSRQFQYFCKDYIAENKNLGQIIFNCRYFRRNQYHVLSVFTM